MSLFGIAWRSIRQRSLASALTSLSMALGVMLVVAVLSIHGVVSQSFRNNASLGYNLIVGAKGGSLQLTLNTVYYLSQPVENIPYEYYLEYLTADRRRQHEADPGDIDLNRDGKFGPYVALAIPLCLGDYVGPFRLVGTTPALFDDLRFGQRGERKYEFAEGRNFQHKSVEYGYFEAVLGAVAARKLGLGLGDQVHPAHGDPEGHTHAQGFTVVGILKQSGTPNDRAVFVNMEGFYLMDDHAKPIEEEETDGESESSGEPQPVAARAVLSAAEHAERATQHKHEDSRREPLAMNQREVTAILVRTINPAVTPGIRNMINEGRDAQATLPVLEIYNLFDVIVRPIQTVLLVLTAMICVVSGISILVSIYNSMSERRQEIAVMRALGAGRDTVMSIILLESVFLSLGGGLAGWLLAHGLNWLASPLIEAQTGVSIHFLDIQLTEALLIPGLILLAVICGFLPALSAYRTDVAKWL
jgi:putative ABC transport system permease protein